MLSLDKQNRHQQEILECTCNLLRTTHEGSFFWQQLMREVTDVMKHIQKSH
jgi:hypothetical protein